jgi:hypothetical protein
MRSHLQLVISYPFVAVQVRVMAIEPDAFEVKLVVIAFIIIHLSGSPNFACL